MHGRARVKGAKWPPPFSHPSETITWLRGVTWGGGPAPPN